MPSRRAYRMARARVLRHAVVPVRDVAMVVSSFLVSARARALVVRVWPCAVSVGHGRRVGGTLCLWGAPAPSWGVRCSRPPLRCCRGCRVSGRGCLLLGGGGLPPGGVPAEPGYHLTAPPHAEGTPLSGDTRRLCVEGDPLTVCQEDRDHR